ncbi:hypothetical protein EHO60_09045 [Leptospira fletcheri]|uniref:Uncharacterized protein n=1 Tax=Leptospira fletcheri TaxID=2484981 RepID=A0A4V3JDX1_9LEPT|nr:hypothetical protein [Leptospira fletcheri]TGK12385.1 hypothetical protein EHO60_09045 [Leptospira fletcheri]
MDHRNITPFSLFIPILATLLQFSCVTSYKVGDPILAKHSASSATENMVGLIGFRPYYPVPQNETIQGFPKSECTNYLLENYGSKFFSDFFKGRRNVSGQRYLAVPKKDQIVAPLDWGVPIAEILFSGMDKTVDQESIRNFIRDFYDQELAGSILDLCELFDWDPIGKNLALKKREVRFYVVGHFVQKFERQTLRGSGIHALTYFFSIFSLGIIPIINEEWTDSLFQIYDSKLHLIRQETVSNSVWSFTGWWISSNDRTRKKETFVYDPPVWERGVAELNERWSPK